MKQRYISADAFAKNQGWKKLINADNHSHESLNWTIRQSHKIDKLGWHQWFLTTRGPKGFQ